MDVYKIGVSLAMTSNAPGVLQALSTQLLHVHTQVKDLQGGLNRVKLAVGGAFAVAGGFALLGALKSMTGHAKDLSHELTQIQKFNISASQLQEVRQTAVGTTRQVGGTTEVDALKIYGSAYSMFGHENALKIMAPVAEFAQVVGNTTKDYEKAFDGVYSMLRAGDLMGKFVNEATHQVDMDKLRGFLELGGKVIQGTHGRVNAQTWLGLAQQGGPALSGMSDQGLLTMAIASQAMGGPRAGTALTSLYQQMVGGKMTKSVAENLRGLGLVGDFDVGRGGHLTFHKGALDTSFTRALKDDPISAVEIMRKAMVAHGETTIDKQVPMLFEILGRQTTQRLVHDLLRNLPQILSERERMTSSMNTTDAKRTQDSQDIVQAERNVFAAWDNLMKSIAGPNGENMIAILNKVTGALNYFTEAVRRMKPETLQSLAIGVGALGAALVAGGGIAILAAIGAGGWLLVGLAAWATAVYIFRDKLEAGIAWTRELGAHLGSFFSGISERMAADIAKATAWIGQAIDQLGRVLMQIPELIGSLGTRIMDAIKGWLPKAGSGPADPSSSGLPIFGGSYTGGALGGTIHQTSLGGAANSNIPGVTGSGGLAIKDGAAAGSFHPALLDAARAGGGGRITALNDHYHHGHGAHGRGLAVDLTGNPGMVMENVRRSMTAAGLTEGRDFRLLNEYARPSARATGGHIHLQFQTKEAADAYQRSQQERAAPLPRVGPPPREQREEVHVHNVHIGGERVAHVVSRQMAAAARYPGSIGGMDDHGSWRPPGTTVSDAA